MDVFTDETYLRAVHKLALGFDALLKQAQELAQKNINIEERLAQVREKDPHVRKSDENSIHDDIPTWLRASTGHNADQPRRQHQAIEDGVDACRVLLKGNELIESRLRSKHESRTMSHEDLERPAVDNAVDALPKGHPQVNIDDQEHPGCPFSERANPAKVRGTTLTASSRPKRRPDSLPTPPTQGPMFEKTPDSHSQRYTISPPPSQSGSISKCPIRLLDERSPEEVAEYFETHKHEIPRSHEICIKRYQSNTESIRQLDAKYGNLVNMLQGLGMKHQPMMSAKEDKETFAELDADSARKVERWAKHIEQTPENDGKTPTADQDLHSSLVMDAGEERQGYFDRPLKEIRVGESPSRPWGISVPTAASTKEGDVGDSEAMPTPKIAGSNPTPSRSQSQIKAVINDDDDARRNVRMGDKSQMLFTGPVFIDYGPEQAAELLEGFGTKPKGVHRMDGQPSFF